MNTLKPEPLTAPLFSAFGDVIETTGRDAVAINNGNCLRYSDLAAIDICPSGVAGVSLFDAKPYQLPVQLQYMERHPLGSQAFFPTTSDPYLVFVAEDKDDAPVSPRAFITSGYQGVNYRRNCWHGVLTPITGRSVFVVVDYIGSGINLEEYWFESPYSIEISNSSNHRTSNRTSNEAGNK